MIVSSLFLVLDNQWVQKIWLFLREVQSWGSWGHFQSKRYQGDNLVLDNAWWLEGFLLRDQALVLIWQKVPFSPCYKEWIKTLFTIVIFLRYAIVNFILGESCFSSLLIEQVTIFFDDWFYVFCERLVDRGAEEC